MTKKKIYVAGPMRGLPKGNLPAFDEAERRWTEAGWQVMSPAQLVRALNYGTDDDFHNANRGHLNHVFQIDFACLFAADAIALLPGWNGSLGATAELALAQVLGLEQYDAVSMKTLQAVNRPWQKLHLARVKPEEPPFNIRIVTPAHHQPEQTCSHCKGTFDDGEDQIVTIDLHNAPITMCRRCYDAAGSNVR